MSHRSLRTAAAACQPDVPARPVELARPAVAATGAVPGIELREAG